MNPSFFLSRVITIDIIFPKEIEYLWLLHYMPAEGIINTQGHTDMTGPVLQIATKE